MSLTPDTRIEEDIPKAIMDLLTSTQGLHLGFKPRALLRRASYRIVADKETIENLQKELLRQLDQLTTLQNEVQILTAERDGARSTIDRLIPRGPLQ